jgi:16S rRNA (cytosine(1402)-N(4))-methyltransferase
MDCTTYHIPVLLNETIQGLDIQPDGTYVDLTYGGGGHSREILSHLGTNGRLYGFDQDLDAMSGALKDDRFLFVRSNFRFLKNWMLYYGHEQIDGILADLGVSSHHFDDEGRGFSFRFDAPLDMRMNQRASLSARRIVEEYSEEQLAEINKDIKALKNHELLFETVRNAGSESLGDSANVVKQMISDFLNPTVKMRCYGKVDGKMVSDLLIRLDIWNTVALSYIDTKIDRDVWMKLQERSSFSTSDDDDDDDDISTY